MRELGWSELKRMKDNGNGLCNKNNGDIKQRGPINYSNRLIIIKLYWDESPLSYENFVKKCNYNDKDNKAPIGQCGKPIAYVNSIMHRTKSGFMFNVVILYLVMDQVVNLCIMVKKLKMKKVDCSI